MFNILEVRLLTFKDRLDYLYMMARNDYIEKLVLSTHSEMLETRPLSVFFVSNKAYNKNRHRVKVHDLPMKGSGIPLLRQHCHKIPARAQFRIGHHFLTVSLKSLVQQVQLWLAGGSGETIPNDATVQRLLESLQGDLKMVRKASSIFMKEIVLVLLGTLISQKLTFLECFKSNTYHRRDSKRHFIGHYDPTYGFVPAYSHNLCRCH